MDLCKGNMNDFKNDNKLENMEKELYVIGCKTNEKVNILGNKIAKIGENNNDPIYSFQSGYLRTVQPFKRPKWL